MLLEKINSPRDLKKLTIPELKILSDELRKQTIQIVSATGGHLGASLGVVELTIALHYAFNTPTDALIWDVGHQSYPHKILTERKNFMHSLRKAGGISGFTKRSESIYDPFGAGHASTSISAALGMAIARDLHKQDHEVIAVIGDGSMSAGLAYEAMNNAGFLKSRMIVVLNDNDMSIAPPVGALSRYLSKLISSKEYLGIRNQTKRILDRLPLLIRNFVIKTEKNAKTIVSGNNFFEELGFYYIGPIDGHYIEDLLFIFENLKADRTITKPILVHVITEKGKGFNNAKGCKEKYHAIGQFDPDTGELIKPESQPKKSYSDIFGDTLLELAKKDPSIVAITAAMPSGTGLVKFANEFPDRFFDVGIAEQHAVTFAAGLACCDVKPFVAIYSTFLQRAYDQIVHDVALQSLPVKFAIDRAGVVGADGPTHAGSFDISYLSNLPNMIVMAPSDGDELAKMINFSSTITNAPVAFRYKRGTALTKISEVCPEIRLGKSRIIQQGKNVAILCVGTSLQCAIDAAQAVKTEYKFDVTIVDVRFIKPLDTELLDRLLSQNQLLITIEEGSSGGFAAHVMDYAAKFFLTNNLKPIEIYPIHYPDEFIEHDDQEKMNKTAGISANEIMRIIQTFKKK